MSWITSALGIVAGAVILNKLQRARNGEPFTDDPNPEFFTDSHGVVHPVRHGTGVHRWWDGDYNESLIQRRAAKRKLTGETSADQQIASQFDRYMAREENKKIHAAAKEKLKRQAKIDKEERLYRVATERDVLAEHLDSEPAAKYTGLIRARGEMRGEVGLIPWEQARKAGLDPDRFRANVIHKDKFGRKYLKWEYVLDQKATELGYDDGDAFKRAIERAAKQKEKLAALDRELKQLERQVA